MKTMHKKNPGLKSVLNSCYSVLTVLVVLTIVSCSDSEKDNVIDIPPEIIQMVSDNSEPTDNQTAGVTVWTLSDMCDDGLAIQATFLEYKDGSATGGAWPPRDIGNMSSFPLACDIGSDICFGASDATGHWGLGVDGTQDCAAADCCVACGDDRGIRLNCG